MLLKVSVQFVSDSFISESIFGDVCELLKEFVLCPVTKDNAFDKSYVQQEKENTKNYILGLINDKKEYASVRCNEIMFADDPYGIISHGYVEDLEEIDEKNLYEFYKDMIKTAAVDIYVSGSFDKTSVKKEIEKNFKDAFDDRDVVNSETVLASIEENIQVKNLVEEMPVSQSKLAMGFNCGIDPRADESYAMALCSCLYGGSAISKLFNNVREKLSLAYYVFSAVDRHKGCMKVNAGIEASKYDEAFNEIMLQLDMMKKGEFTDEEIDFAKKTFKNSVGSVKDSLAATEDFYMGRTLLGVEESVDEYLEKINKVTREEIIAAAEKIQLDTIYFLKGVQGNEI
jgi:predicted Zn-dependent peptidase